MDQILVKLTAQLKNNDELVDRYNVLNAKRTKQPKALVEIDDEWAHLKSPWSIDVTSEQEDSIDIIHLDFFVL